MSIEVIAISLFILIVFIDNIILRMEILSLQKLVKTLERKGGAMDELLKAKDLLITSYEIREKWLSGVKISKTKQEHTKNQKKVLTL